MHVTMRSINSSSDRDVFRYSTLGVAGCPNSTVLGWTPQQQYLDLILVQRKLGCHDVPTLLF